MVVVVMVRVARAGNPSQMGVGMMKGGTCGFQGQVDPATKSRIRLKPNRVPEDSHSHLTLSAAALDIGRSSQ